MPGVETWLGEALARAAAEDSRICVLDGDLVDSDGALPFAERYPDRFFMAGISEQNMVSVAAGMASCGMRPWVFSFAAFLCFRAYDQIRMGLAGARQPVTIVGAKAGGLSGRSGKSHAALNDLALMLSLPEIDVWCPADQHDIALAVECISQSNGPAYVRLSRAKVSHSAALPRRSMPGRGPVWLSDWRPRAIVTTGAATHWVQSAMPWLASCDVGHLHVPYLSRRQSYAKAIGPVEAVVAVEDHVSHGGLASLLAADAGRPFLRSVSWPDDWVGRSGDEMSILEQFGMVGEPLANRIRQAFETGR